jgi:anti-sigma B factor antagonist
MKYYLDKQETYTLIGLEEEKLDSTVSPNLKSELVTLNAEGVRNMVLDLTNVKYTDSSGLSAILVANRLCKDAGGTLAIAGVSEHTLKLIRISQLDTVLNILPTRQEAIDAVMMDDIEGELRSEASQN